ncbi:MAG: glycosyltransferase [Chitinophagaceae bacterium]|nr:glycosyltransferase [Chitinophagaceae bacterium]
MSDHTIPLLSIVIPTKNRQFTCLYAIESALLINNDDFEVVVQDCSDTNILKKQIHDKFGMDPRIKYFYLSEKLSMTENWNRAFSNTKGEYICAIGDDDAVLPAIYEITKGAKERNLNMVKHPQVHTIVHGQEILLEVQKGYLT